MWCFWWYHPQTFLPEMRPAMPAMLMPTCEGKQLVPFNSCCHRDMLHGYVLHQAGYRNHAGPDSCDFRCRCGGPLTGGRRTTRTPRRACCCRRTLAARSCLCPTTSPTPAPCWTTACASCRRGTRRSRCQHRGCTTLLAATSCAGMATRASHPYAALCDRTHSR